MAEITRSDPWDEIESFQITSREAGGVRILDVRGRITLGPNSDRLHEELIKLTEAGSRNILVNLSGTEQIDSSGISALVRHCTSLKNEGGSLKLVCPQGRVRKALTVTRLLDLMPAFDDERSALASFQ